MLDWVSFVCPSSIHVSSHHQSYKIENNKPGSKPHKATTNSRQSDRQRDITIMPRRGRQRKKSRTQEISETAAASSLTTVEKIPKSLIIRRGKTCPELVELIQDVRRMMLPYTALNFKEDPKNRKLTLQQYATHLALPMGITHIGQFSQSTSDHGERVLLRLGRLPAGPVLHFRVHQFTLSRDIQKLQRRPMSATAASMTHHPAITVTNNFNSTVGGAGGGSPPPHVKLMNITFQNLFPQINVSTVQLHECKRVVLFDRHDATGHIHVRHYAITTKSANVHKRLVRLQKATAHLPNLHKCQDIADYLEAGYKSDNGGYKSDYASDDEEETRTILSSTTGASNKVQSALKLVELGPRLELELIKVEKDLEKASTVLYHATATPEELAARAAARQRQQEEKAERRKVQDENVSRKEAERKRKRDAKKSRQRPPPTTKTTTAKDDVEERGEDDSDGEDDEASEDEE
jgi:ribosome biogenesis protein SSF1/2